MADAMRSLGTPQPGEDICSHDGDSGCNCNTGKVLLRARFSMREGVSADYDGDEAGGFGNCPGKQCLQGADTGIKWRSVSSDWDEQYAEKQCSSTRQKDLCALNR